MAAGYSVAPEIRWADREPRRSLRAHCSSPVRRSSTSCSTSVTARSGRGRGLRN